MRSFHSRADQPVKHTGLMLEHHEGDDVAVRRQIKTRRESIAQVDHVDSVLTINLLGPFWLLGDHVAHVLLAAARAGDVPTSPALGERARVVGAERPAGEKGIALPVHEQRPDEMPGEALIGR